MRFAHGPMALNCAESGCTQAVALLGRQGPVFPAARGREPPHGGECVFPAMRGKRGAQRSLFDGKNPVERALSV